MIVSLGLKCLELNVRRPTAQHIGDSGNNEKNNKDDEQNAGYINGTRSNASKTQYASYQRNN
jgi:hypothetical protein